MILMYKDVKLIFDNFSYQDVLPKVNFDEVIDRNKDKFSNKLIITQFKSNNLVRSVLLYSSNNCPSIDDKLLIQEKENVYFCFGSSVYNWNIVSASLVWKTEVDLFICLAIHKIHNEPKVLIHSEAQLTMINLNGKILWTYSGSDIFVNVNRTEVLNIMENEISIIDWNNIVHVLDLEGNLLHDYHL